MSFSKELPDSLCVVPWINASLDVNGAIRPCCKFSHQASDSIYQLGNLKDLSLQDLWNSSGMQLLRKNFLAGIKPKECSTCWNEEASGMTSYRQTFLEGRVENPDIDYTYLTPSAPKTLDLKVSNVCNLKCRICGPVASSSWLKEMLEHNPADDPYLRDNDNYFLSNKITEKPDNLEAFIQWLPGINHVEIFGGEPFLSRENREIEDLMIDRGEASHISLLYNTNITIFREDMKERWEKFKRVTICLSLDDIGARLEYERTPSDWSQIERNLASYRKINGGNKKIILFCSVSNYNIWYLPEYILWRAEHCPELELNFNIVHNDAELAIVQLPEAMKKKVRVKFTQFIEKSQLDSKDPVLAEKLIHVLSFMESRSGDTELWLKFLRKTQYLDRIRKQSFSSVFPDYFEALEAESAFTCSTRLP